MGNDFLLLAASFSILLLLASRGTNAARLYPANEPVQAQISRNATSSWIRRLVAGQVSPLDTEAGSLTRYYADHQASAADKSYFGLIVTMDVYGLSLSGEQASLASVWLSDTGLGSIQVGWQVMPSLYGDSRTHLDAFWTNDGFVNTGCRDARCSVGFQPEKGAPIAIGDVIENVSQPKGLKQTITIKVIKDGVEGDWLVHYGANTGDLALIGRFPRSLFTGGLADQAALMQFGGYVATYTTNLAPMGSGYFPMGSATDTMAFASMSNIQLIDQNGQASPVPQDLPIYTSDPSKYAATPIADGGFFYGGPLQSTEQRCGGSSTLH